MQLFWHPLPPPKPSHPCFASNGKMSGQDAYHWLIRSPPALCHCFRIRCGGEHAVWEWLNIKAASGVDATGLGAEAAEGRLALTSQNQAFA